MDNPFKWRHYQGAVILLCVRWYLRYGLSYRDLAEVMAERGLTLSHTTIFRWVQAYAPELERRVRRHLKASNDSWRVDETYIKVRGKWLYLYRAVDSTGQTIDFLLTQTRSKRAARRFFRRALAQPNATDPRVITTDQNAAFPGAIDDMKAEGLVSKVARHRTSKYLNNIVEQDHRFIKRQMRVGLGFATFETAWRTLQGYEALSMIRKGQVKDLSCDGTCAQRLFVHGLFGLAA